MGSQRRSLPPLPSLLAVGWGLVLLGILVGIPGDRARAGAAPAHDSGPNLRAAAGTIPAPEIVPAPTVPDLARGPDSPRPSDGTSGPSLLAPIVDELRRTCGSVDLRVVWSISESIAVRLSSYAGAELNRVQGDGCSDRVVVQVTVGEGAERARYLVAGDVELWGPGLRAARTLRPGSLLEADDVVEGEGWFPPSACREAAANVEGAYLARGVPAGRVIGQGDVGPPPLVRRGETVRLVYRGLGLELRTVGTARADGWMGDRLAVRAQGAQHDCSAVVAGPDVVEVESEGRRR